MTTLRRLAATLLRSAVATLPPDRRPWGAAMLAELEQVPGDLRAVRWALGGVRAAGHVRRAAIARVAPVPVRLLLAASWRRRAGVGPGWLTRPAAAAAETAVVVASLAVWALWLVPWDRTASG